MQLKDFVSMTLQEVLQGVHEAQEKIAGKNVGTVVPFYDQSLPTPKPQDISPYQNINFEIAISIEKSSNGGASISVLSGILGGKLGGELKNADSKINKISFSVPVFYSERTVNS